MKNVTVHRANDAPEGCTITIGEPFSEAVKNVDGSPPSTTAISHVVCYEADAIAEALFKHLPIWVSARIGLLMLQRYSNHQLGGPRR